VAIKDMESGEQRTIERREAAQFMKEFLAQRRKDAK
jgi:hypothetical protein